MWFHFLKVWKYHFYSLCNFIYAKYESFSRCLVGWWLVVIKENMHNTHGSPESRNFSHYVSTTVWNFKHLWKCEITYRNKNACLCVRLSLYRREKQTCVLDIWKTNKYCFLDVFLFETGYQAASSAPFWTPSTPASLSWLQVGISILAK